MFNFVNCPLFSLKLLTYEETTFENQVLAREIRISYSSWPENWLKETPQLESLSKLHLQSLSYLIICGEFPLILAPATTVELFQQVDIAYIQNILLTEFTQIKPDPNHWTFKVTTQYIWTGVPLQISGGTPGEQINKPS